MSFKGANMCMGMPRPVCCFLDQMSVDIKKPNYTDAMDLKIFPVTRW